MLKRQGAIFQPEFQNRGQCLTGVGRIKVRFRMMKAKVDDAVLLVPSAAQAAFAESHLSRPTPCRAFVPSIPDLAQGGIQPWRSMR
jgi:hypothetical protein